MMDDIVSALPIEVVVGSALLQVNWLSHALWTAYLVLYT